MAAALAPRGDFLFAIAGVMPARREPTSIMSSLSAPSKRPSSIKLYRATDIVLAPLRSGTGTSLKVLEAFVHEKALVATRTGVRGYPVRDGMECVVCDEPHRYPEILSSLRADPGRLARARRSGTRVSSGAYDYRVVYRPYLECIDRLLRWR